MGPLLLLPSPFRAQCSKKRDIGRVLGRFYARRPRFGDIGHSAAQATNGMVFASMWPSQLAHRGLHLGLNLLQDFVCRMFPEQFPIVDWRAYL